LPSAPAITQTTALCLHVLSDLSKRRRFANVLDLGCGTGLLAIGAAKLWRKAVLASDIDPVAVEVTKENARANGEAPLIRALTADGLDHPRACRAGNLTISSSRTSWPVR